MAAPEGGYWFGADPAEQTQYGNWAHRFGALSADLAKEHSKPQWGIEATAANLIEHHGIHGAMWTIVTQTKDYSEAWKLHGEVARTSLVAAASGRGACDARMKCMREDFFWQWRAHA